MGAASGSSSATLHAHSPGSRLKGAGNDDDGGDHEHGDAGFRPGLGVQRPESSARTGAAQGSADKLAAWKAGPGAPRVAAFERARASVVSARGRAEALAQDVNRKKIEVDAAASALRSPEKSRSGDSAETAELRVAQEGYKKCHSMFQDAKEELAYVRGQARRAKAVLEAGFRDWLETGDASM